MPKGCSPAFVLKRMQEHPEGHVEGYWAMDKKDKSRPFPQKFKGTWEDKDTFCDKVHSIEEKLEADQMFYRGMSESRLEPGEMVGSGEHRDLVNGVLWPEGYAEHYIRKHNVLPSEEFYEYVMAFVLGDGPNVRLEAWHTKWGRPAKAEDAEGAPKDAVVDKADAAVVADGGPQPVPEK